MPLTWSEYVTPLRNRKRSSPLDPVRQLIVDQAKRKNISQGYLSEVLGKNRAWMNQFILRSSPKTLDSEQRAIIAEALDLKPEQLILPVGGRKPVLVRPTSPIYSPSAVQTKIPSLDSRPTPSTADLASTTNPEVRVPAEMTHQAHRATSNLAGKASVAINEVNQYYDTDILPAELIEVRGTFSLFVTSARNRLRPGDEVTATGAVPARLGDLVVVVKEGRVVAMGELATATRGIWRVIESEVEVPGVSKEEATVHRKIETVSRDGAYLFRIISARFI